MASFEFIRYCSRGNQGDALLAALPRWFPFVLRCAVDFACFGPALLHPVIRKVPLRCLAAFASWRARGLS